MKVFVVLCIAVFGSGVIAQEATPPPITTTTPPPPPGPPITTTPLPPTTTAAPPPPIVLPGGKALVTSCNKGMVISNGGVVVGTFAPVNCDFTKGNSCQTKIDVTSDGTTMIDRQCKQTKACENNAKANGGNFKRCYPGNNKIRQCWHCCNTHLCNNFDEIPVEVVTATETVPSVAATEPSE